MRIIELTMANANASELAHFFHTLDLISVPPSDG
jgi:hypothetical protein